MILIKLKIQWIINEADINCETNQGVFEVTSCSIKFGRTIMNWSNTKYRFTLISNERYYEREFWAINLSSEMVVTLIWLTTEDSQKIVSSEIVGNAIFGNEMKKISTEQFQGDVKYQNSCWNRINIHMGNEIKVLPNARMANENM